MIHHVLLACPRGSEDASRSFYAGLLGLTDQAERVPESGTYQERQLASVTTPGALVEGWRLTL